MENKAIVIVRRILSILLSVSILITAICFIGGCLSIYGSGESEPYSRQAVADTFGKISILVYLCIALAVLSLIFELICPTENAKPKAEKDYKALIERLSAKKDISSNEIVFNMIITERKKRKIERIAFLGILAITSFVFLFYALNPDNYANGAEITGSVITLMSALTPLLLIDFSASVLIAYRAEASFARELELIKQLPNAKNISEKQVVESSPRKIVIIKLSLILISAIIIVSAYFCGGAADVLTKAINICTECIGLG